MWYLKSAFDTYQKVQDAVQSRLGEVQSAILSPVDMMKKFMGAPAPSPASSRSWRTAATITSRSPTVSAARGTASSFSTAPSPTRALSGGEHPHLRVAPGQQHLSEQRSLIMKLKTMVAQLEDTRDHRLMRDYHRGTAPEMDRAIELVPRILEAMKLNPQAPPSTDAFQEMAL